MRFPGDHTIAAMLSRGTRGGTYLRKIEPASATLPMAGELVVRVTEQELDRMLEGLRKQSDRRARHRAGVGDVADVG